MSCDYYGDNDKHVCAWMRELIRGGHLPEGTIDGHTHLGG